MVGKVDVNEDKLYVELHNFDFISTNAAQYDLLYESSSSTLAQHSVSEKRFRLYETLTETTQQTNHQKTSDTRSSTTSSLADDQPVTDSDNANQPIPPKNQYTTDKSSKTQKQPVKRELRSSKAIKKISDLATAKLDLTTYNKRVE